MNPPRRFSELLSESGIPVRGKIPELEITRVTDDSRQVVPGALFVAVKGAAEDGHRFLPQAIARGARAVLLEEDLPVPEGVFKWRIPSTRPALARLASSFYGFPSRRLRMVAVTGTNGKTTVAWILRHLLEKQGTGCGLIGTVCHEVGRGAEPSKNTTPGAVLLQELLSRMVEAGLRACAMEVSSHALDQGRTDGIEFGCGVFTNLTPEHLDYHATPEEYLKAKLRLFQGLHPLAPAVINRDDPAWLRVREAAKGPILLYGLRREADLTAEEIRLSLEGTSCRVKTPRGVFAFRWNLIGRHNLENLLAAVGAAASLGTGFEEALAAAEDFRGVPGRLERIEGDQPFPVFVDYAHTEDALKKVVSELRAAGSGRITVVFGCGGDRDRTKRPRMGRVAGEMCDSVIVTSDNPRSEDPARIAGEVAAGLKGTPASWRVILDRRAAIQAALESAGEGEIVLIAGKGHETSQVFGKETVPFDDRAVARQILRTLKQVTQ
ncbi:MAG: UDP-N-acetylmuramoyl-L-alanyl-D-glutamate--2,6-diaminopimelate ligase [Candidatus Omnitrophica bacterium]|nr:UDP-N-acetylmuramoyl-L-alanyl-D-glutamate--2,6-diaminopimelate ligase [Candidatus Omnitrophota bacterium]